MHSNRGILIRQSSQFFQVTSKDSPDSKTEREPSVSLFHWSRRCFIGTMLKVSEMRLIIELPISINMIGYMKLFYGIHELLAIADMVLLAQKQKHSIFKICSSLKLTFRDNELGRSLTKPYFWICNIAWKRLEKVVQQSGRAIIFLWSVRPKLKKNLASSFPGVITLHIVFQLVCLFRSVQQQQKRDKIKNTDQSRAFKS